MREHYESEERKKLRPESLMMSYAYRPEWSEGAAKSPIFQTSTFVFESAEQGKAFFELAYGLRDPEAGEKAGLIYSRINNPDLEILEDRLTLWDKAEDCAVFSSGMAAITTTMLSYLRPGDRLLFSEPVYGGTDHFIMHVLPELGITPVRFHARNSEEEIESLLADAGSGRLGMVFIETPANPTNDLIDIAMSARIAARHQADGYRAPLVVDNTFLGPVFSQPLEHGADLVVYSATKFIGGHGDLVAGACLGSEAALAPVRAMRSFMGTMAGPWTGWLIMRSLETLKLRMTRQVENAKRVADFLLNHPKVAVVHYLGHLDAGHPQYEIYKRQCLAPGAMISFEVEGGQPGAYRFLNALILVKLAVSLGGTESLAEHPYTMTHADVDAAEKLAAGITEGLVRLSIGVEHSEDLINDISQALDKT